VISLNFTESEKAMVLIAADEQFQHSYAQQLKLMNIWANATQTDFTIVAQKDFPACNIHKNYFFKKHCMTAEFLDKQPHDMYLAVFDADVVPLKMSKGEWPSLLHWLRKRKGSGDVMLYNRCWNDEIAAGNYIVRNTQAAKFFLRHWASYEWKMPRGFSSADNGAVHVVVPELLELPGRAECKKQYDNLMMGMTIRDGPHKGQDPNGRHHPYHAFIMCTQNLLGEKKTPSSYYNEKYDITIDIYDKKKGWIMDHMCDGRRKEDRIDADGALFHHGVKDPSVVLLRYV
jgi:hypothetical protein